MEATKRIPIGDRNLVLCPECKGTGAQPIPWDESLEMACDECAATGWVYEHETVS